MKNRTFAKLISLVLALLMVATVFVACNKDEGTSEGSDTTAAAQNGETENKAPENAYTADTEGVVDLSEYTIIFPDGFDGDGTKATTTSAHGQPPLPKFTKSLTVAPSILS